MGDSITLSGTNKNGYSNTVGVNVLNGVDTTIVEIDLQNSDEMSMTIVNGLTALQAFDVYMESVPGAGFVKMYTLAADYTVPDNVFLKFSSVSPVTLGISTTCKLDWKGLAAQSKMRLVAQGNAGDSVVKYYLKVTKIAG